jgi:MbtH protein
MCTRGGDSGNQRATVCRESEVTADDEEDSAIYAVVVNKEEQYSIWPIHKAMPRGWRPVGKQARKAECLRYIDEVWTDMRPLSLRRTMEASSRQGNPSKKFDSNS